MSPPPVSEAVPVTIGEHNHGLIHVPENSQKQNVSQLEQAFEQAAAEFFAVSGKDPRGLVTEVLKSFPLLTGDQQDWLMAAIRQFLRPHTFWKAPKSDWITEKVLQGLGDGLRLHHAFSRQSLSKDKFEFAFEAALKRGGFQAELTKSRTNPGRDILIDFVPVSLKTEAADAIQLDSLHISKYMELGKGEWNLSEQRQKFFDHMKKYDRIFQFRCHEKGPDVLFYELVEIPKSILEEARNFPLEIQEDSKQTPKPGYCRVLDSVTKEQKLALYFDGGTERKLQVKHIKKSYCQVHATWRFESATLQ